MPRPKSKIYSEADWENADEMERLFIHLMEPTRWPLRPVEAEKLDNLRKVWAVMVTNSTHRARIQLISDLVAVSERTAYRWMEEASHLFNIDLNPDFEKAYLVQRLWELADKAEAEFDFKAAERAMSKIAQIRGFDREDGGLKPGELQIPVALFTSNPKALSNQKIEADDAEFIELDADQGDLFQRETVGIPVGQPAD